MPPLAPVLLEAVQNLAIGAGFAIVGNNPMGGALACWNWGFTGFAINKVWPSHMFDYIVGVTDAAGLAAVPANQGQAWLVANQAALDAVSGQFALDAMALPWATAVGNAVAAITNLAAAANGLVTAVGVTPYELVVKYQVGAGIMPSFHHVWLRINGRTIEVFPGMQDIQITQLVPHIGAGFATYATYLNGLLPLQVARILATMTNGAGQIVVNPPPVAMGARGVWINSAARATCQWCDGGFGGPGAKHCHRCGEVFCQPCMRQSAGAVPNPAGSTLLVSMGQVPTCIRCIN